MQIHAEQRKNEASIQMSQQTPDLIANDQFPVNGIDEEPFPSLHSLQAVRFRRTLAPTREEKWSTHAAWINMLSAHDFVCSQCEKKCTLMTLEKYHAAKHAPTKGLSMPAEASEPLGLGDHLSIAAFAVQSRKVPNVRKLRAKREPEALRSHDRLGAVQPFLRLRHRLCPKGRCTAEENSSLLLLPYAL